MTNPTKEQQLESLKLQLKNAETAYYKILGAIELLESLIKAEKEKKDEVE